MKVGLLLCDHVNPEYRNKFGDYSDMFSNLFPEFKWKFYDAINGELPININECDAYMATGSRFSVYDKEDWINDLKSFIQTLQKAKKCYVGICFGHQMIGEALGGKVEKSSKGWGVGVQEFEPMGLSLLMMCQDQIAVLPQNTVVLAGNKLCKNGIIQIENHILGIQAHPEFTKEYNQLLIENRMSRIGEKKFEIGLKSLEKPVM